MPYTYKKVGNKYCVYKKEGGAKVGCTDGNKTALKKYLTALHINESHSMDHEVSMAEKQLEDIIRNAVELIQKLGSMERNIPGWIQDHISQSQNFINQANYGFHELNEDKPCWKDYEMVGMKMKGGKQVPNCVPKNERIVYRNESLRFEIVESDEPYPIEEADYQGKKVELGQVKRGGNKKFYVYVKNPKTDNIKKVSFGDTTGLSIKTKDADRRRSFRARHNCDSPGPRDKARYWSCRMWSGPNAVQNMLK
jgi:hypothetical protein